MNEEDDQRRVEKGREKGARGCRFDFFQSSFVVRLFSCFSVAFTSFFSPFLPKPEDRKTAAIDPKLYTLYTPRKKMRGRKIKFEQLNPGIGDYRL